MKTMVSIITPCYNARPYLPATWRSIKRQTFTDWEWVIWEDGSTDGSAEWLAELAKRDTRVRVFGGERTGRAGAGRNRCILHSGGEFIAFLDADDLWHPLFLEKQLGTLKSHSSHAIAYCNMREFYSEAEKRATPPPRVWDRKDLGNEALRAVLEKGVATPFTFMMKREVFDTVGPFEEKLSYEDYEWTIRALQRYSLIRTRGLLAAYRIHPSNSTKTWKKSFEGHELLYQVLERKGLLKGQGGKAFRSVYALRKLEHILDGHLNESANAALVFAWYWWPANLSRWILLSLLLVPRSKKGMLYRFLKTIQKKGDRE
jgi:glycosyltransferase involved in cell wall biosynthesis